MVATVSHLPQPAAATHGAGSSGRLRLWLGAIGLVALLTISGPAAQPGSPAGSPPSALESLDLDDGRLWPVDTALRQGMHRILDLVEQSLASAEGPDHVRLADALLPEIDAIARACTLAPAARARLDVILDELRFAADEMRHGEPIDRDAGLVRAIVALDAYGAYFDDPGWSSQP